jgi:hypothetical protein
MNPFKQNGPSVALTQLYERTSRQGRRYLVGRIGSAKLMIVATGEDSRGDPVWQVYLGEGPHTPDGAAALAQEIDA